MAVHLCQGGKGTPRPPFSRHFRTEFFLVRGKGRKTQRRGERSCFDVSETCWYGQHSRLVQSVRTTARPFVPGRDRAPWLVGIDRMMYVLRNRQRSCLCHTRRIVVNLHTSRSISYNEFRLIVGPTNKSRKTLSLFSTFSVCLSLKTIKHTE